MRLLYVEDEQDILETTTKRLERDGHTVDACENGPDALSFIEVTEYDVIILDIMLPGMNGLDILRRIRALKITTPVLLLTARDSIEDRVGGLDAGSDDYLVKPFAYEEMVARIRALGRRLPAEDITNILTVGDLTLDTATREVIRDGKAIRLSAREYSLLEYMMRNPGIVLSRDRIEQAIYNYDFEGGSNVVDVYIRYLRKKIDAGFDSALIHTVRGSGYVLKEEGK